MAEALPSLPILQNRGSIKTIDLDGVYWRRTMDVKCKQRHHWQNVPMRGSFFVLVGATFAFVCTTVAIGTLISTYCDNHQQASMGGFLFMFPAMMFSGIMFPIENMPAAVQWMAFLDPLSHYLGLLRNIMLKGGDPRYVATHVSVLAAMAVVSVMASFKRFHTTLQ